MASVEEKLLLEKAKESYINGRLDLSYVYANEARLLSTQDELPSQVVSLANAKSATTAECALHCALYKIMPARRLVVGAELLLKEARKALVEEKHYDKALGFAHAAHLLETVKTPAPLLLQAETYSEIGRHAKAYVFAGEALELMGGMGYYPSSLQSQAKKKLAGFALQQKPVPTQRMREVLDQYAPPYHHSLWPSNVELGSLNVTWRSVNEAPHCVLEGADGVFLKPEVRFHDLPTFFAKHASADLPVRRFRLTFVPNSLIEPPRPTESMLRVLLETSACSKANSRGHQVSLFNNVEYAMLIHADFHNITAATFNQLFTRLLAAETLHILDLKRLPIGVKPADFLQHPSLLACPTLVFSYFTLACPEVAQVATRCTTPGVVQFTSAAVLAHLKAKRSNVFSELFIHETYLAGGMAAMAEEARRDFLSASQPSEFEVIISYSHASSFDSRIYGEWNNSLGERLRIDALDTETSRKIPILDNHQVGICRWNPKEKKRAKKCAKK